MNGTPTPNKFKGLNLLDRQSHEGALPVGTDLLSLATGFHPRNVVSPLGTETERNFETQSRP